MMVVMSQTYSDLIRRVENQIVIGTVAEVDHARALVKLSLSGRKTNWLAYPADIGANYRRWRPLRIGTQVVALCPSGDPAQAVIGQILYTTSIASPANAGTLDLIEFNDGALVSYDSDAQVFTLKSAGKLSIVTASDVDVKAGGAVSITAAATAAITAPNVQIIATNGSGSAAQMQGSFSLKGDFSVEGNIGVKGNISATGAVMDGGGNSNHHSHGG